MLKKKNVAIKVTDEIWGNIFITLDLGTSFQSGTQNPEAILINLI